MFQIIPYVAIVLVVAAVLWLNISSRKARKAMTAAERSSQDKNDKAFFQQW